MNMRVTSSDHVQLAMPSGREPEARAFYGMRRRYGSESHSRSDRERHNEESVLDGLGCHGESNAGSECADNLLQSRRSGAR
jgi:hypothetical protein